MSTSETAQRLKRSRLVSPFLWFCFFLMLKMALLRYLLFGQVAGLPLLGDLAAIAAIGGLLELLSGRRSRPILFWVVNVLLSLLFFAAALYYQYFGSVVTYTSLHEVGQLSKIKSSVKATIEPKDWLFFLDVIPMIPIYWRLRRPKSAELRAAGLPIRPMHLPWFVSILLILIGVGYGYGSIRKSEDIVNELKRAETLGFFNYEAFVFWDLSQNTNTFTNLADAAKAVRRQQRTFTYSTSTKKVSGAGQLPYFGKMQGKNVIVLQMEAFQNFPIHLSLNGQVLTPVLNKLADEGLYFPHIFQQIGPGNTSDAEFMSNTSIYPTGTIAMSTGYGDRALPSMPRLLEAIGYEADTFHVNDVTFWDRNKLYPAIGFSHYFDKPNYVNDHFNEFGASDVNLYIGGMKVLTELTKEQRPFYAQFITVSSHYPFKIPEQYQTLVLPDSIKGKQLGDYLQSIHYTDYAIGTFIDQLKSEGIWDDSLLVAYGDHFGLQPQDTDPKLVESALDIPYHPQLSRFNIPLIIHFPDQTKGQVIDQVGGQLDIMPTIANLIGMSLDQQQYVHFGQDLLNINRNVFGMRYYLPTGSFFNDQILFMPGKRFDDGTAFDIRTLQPVADFTQYRSDFDYIMKLMQLSDEYVKLLPKR